MRRALVLVALFSARAWADAPTDPAANKAAAATHFAEGQQRFNAGSFLPAAEEFEAAYELDPDPVYLYNIAQAYRRGSACARAADYYRRFLAVVPNPPNLAKVTRYLDELDACAKAETPVVEAPQPKPVPVAPPTPLRIRAHDDPGRFERHLGLAVSIAGVAVLGLGAWFTHDVHTLEGYGDALCAPGVMCEWDAGKQARAADLQQRGDRATTLSFGAYALGGAALVGGAVLYMLGNRTPSEQIEIVPVQGGGVAVTTFAF